MHSIIRATLAMGALAIAMQAAASADGAAIEAPAFKAGSWWVYRVHGQGGGRSFDNRIQWTLAYETVDHRWTFFRTEPDPTLAQFGMPHKSSEQRVYPIPSGATSPAWEGRDSHGDPDKNPANWLSFPLLVDKSWVDQRPPSAIFQRHRVVSWEDVTVAGRTWHALRVEAENVNAAAPTVPLPSTHRVDWYVPEIQNIVRERMETPNGGVTEFELESYSLSN